MSRTMTEITKPLAEYIEDVTLREPEVMAGLRRETAELGGIARMQIAPEQGQFMGLMARLLKAKSYLEVGTFTGYSALAVALALPSDGRIIACDVSREWTDIGRAYWEEAGVAGKIDLRIGSAVETLEALLSAGKRESFDMMFIDADKVSYDAYYELGLKLVRPGGLIMIDNVLWGGSVVDPDDQDEDTRAIRTLNEKLHRDERIDLSLLTIGDGLTLARKR